MVADPTQALSDANDSLTQLNVTDGFLNATVFISLAAYLVLLFIALITILIFIVVLFVGRKIFKEYPFFTIVWNLIAGNLLNIIVQWTIVVPMMIFGVDTALPFVIWWTDIGGVLLNFTEESTTYFTFIIACNRLCIFLRPSYTVYFKGKYLYFVCAITWLWIILITIFKTLNGFDVDFNSSTMNFDRNGNVDEILQFIFEVIGYLVPLICLLFYLIIFCHLYRQRGKQNFAKIDVRILKEATGVTVILELARLSQHIIPRINNSNSLLHWMLQLFLNLVSIANHSINSILFLSHNGTVKRVLFSIVGKSYDTSSHQLPAKTPARSSSAPGRLQKCAKKNGHVEHHK